MIRLSANLSKKVPLPGIDYSSQQFGASLEVEISDGNDPAAIQHRIHDLYAMLATAIDAQIEGAGAPRPISAPHVGTGRFGNTPPSNGNGQRNGRANGNGRRVHATEAQCRAIRAICQSQGTDLNTVLPNYNVTRIEDLHIKDASRLIDELKAGQNVQPR